LLLFLATLTSSSFGCGAAFRASESDGDADAGAGSCSDEACGGAGSESGGNGATGTGGSGRGNAGGASAGSTLGGEGGETTGADGGSSVTAGASQGGSEMNGGTSQGGSEVNGGTNQGGSEVNGGTSQGGSEVNGGTNQGGMSGSGGAAGRPTCAPTTRFVFEDCERASSYFEADDAMGTTINGGWAIVGDEAGDATWGYTSPARPEGGSYVMLCVGGDYTDWGGGCMAAFGGGYDAQSPGFDAVEFWARSSNPITLRVEVPDRTSSPAGGQCDREETCVGNCCYNNYGGSVTTGTDWARYTLRFSELTRQGDGGPPLPFDPSFVGGLQFLAPPNGDFELYFDDLAFIACPD
jgi:hypothetical protein